MFFAKSMMPKFLCMRREPRDLPFGRWLSSFCAYRPGHSSGALYNPSCDLVKRITLIGDLRSTKSCRILDLFFHLRIICTFFFLCAPHGQEFRMARWKCKMVHKVQPLSREPISHNIFRVLSAEFAKLLCLDLYTFAAAGFDFGGLEPAAR